MPQGKYTYEQLAAVLHEQYPNLRKYGPGEVVHEAVKLNPAIKNLIIADPLEGAELPGGPLESLQARTMREAEKAVKAPRISIEDIPPPGPIPPAGPLARRDAAAEYFRKNAGKFGPTVIGMMEGASVPMRLTQEALRGTGEYEEAALGGKPTFGEGVAERLKPTQPAWADPQQSWIGKFLSWGPVGPLGQAVAMYPEAAALLTDAATDPLAYVGVGLGERLVRMVEGRIGRKLAQETVQRFTTGFETALRREATARTGTMARQAADLTAAERAAERLPGQMARASQRPLDLPPSRRPAPIVPGGLGEAPPAAPLGELGRGIPEAPLREGGPPLLRPSAAARASAIAAPGPLPVPSLENATPAMRAAPGFLDAAQRAIDEGYRGSMVDLWGRFRRTAAPVAEEIHAVSAGDRAVAADALQGQGRLVAFVKREGGLALHDRPTARQRKYGALHGPSLNAEELRPFMGETGLVRRPRRRSTAELAGRTQAQTAGRRVRPDPVEIDEMIQRAYENGLIPEQDLGVFARQLEQELQGLDELRQRVRGRVSRTGAREEAGQAVAGREGWWRTAEEADLPPGPPSRLAEDRLMDQVTELVTNDPRAGEMAVGDLADDALRRLGEEGADPAVVARVAARIREELSGGPQFARTKSGKIAIGADPKALGRVLGSSLYRGEIGKVAARELFQNAVDAVRPLGDRGYVAFQTGTNPRGAWLQVSDNGPGMTPDEIATLFTDLGASGKRGEAAASGGFGIAKAAPLLGGEYVEVRSVVRERGLLGDHLIVTDLEGSPEQLLAGVTPTIRALEPLPAAEEGIRGTGLTVRTYASEQETRNASYYVNDFGEHAARTDYPTEVIDTRSTQAASDTLQDAWNRAHNDFQYFQSDPGRREDLRGIHKRTLAPVTQRVEVALEEGVPASFTVHAPPAGGTYVTQVHVLNNGLWQFDLSMRPGLGYGIEFGIPKDVYVDVRAAVPEGSRAYPFMANREGLRDTAEEAVRGWVKTNVFEPWRKEGLAALNETFRRLGDVSTREGVPVYDVGARLTPEEVQRVTENPAFRRLGAAIQKALNRILEFVENPGEIVHRGIILHDEVRGIYIPHPAGTSGGRREAAILVNPFARMSKLPGDLDAATAAAEGLTSGGRPTPDLLAASYHHTVLHEAAHRGVSGVEPHGEGFTTALADLFERYGMDRALTDLQELRHAIDPGSTGRLDPAFDDVLSLYEASRQRPPVQSDALVRSGTAQAGPPRERRGPRGDRGGVAPGRRARGDLPPELADVEGTKLAEDLRTGNLGPGELLERRALRRAATRPTEARVLGEQPPLPGAEAVRETEIPTPRVAEEPPFGLTREPATPPKPGELVLTDEAGRPLFQAAGAHPPADLGPRSFGVVNPGNEKAIRTWIRKHADDYGEYPWYQKARLELEGGNADQAWSTLEQARRRAAAFGATRAERAATMGAPPPDTLSAIQTAAWARRERALQRGARENPETGLLEAPIPRHPLRARFASTRLSQRITDAIIAKVDPEALVHAPGVEGMEKSRQVMEQALLENAPARELKRLLGLTEDQYQKEILPYWQATFSDMGRQMGAFGNWVQAHLNDMASLEGRGVLEQLFGPGQYKGGPPSGMVPRVPAESTLTVLHESQRSAEKARAMLALWAPSGGRVKRPIPGRETLQAREVGKISGFLNASYGPMLSQPVTATRNLIVAMPRYQMGVLDELVAAGSAHLVGDTAEASLHLHTARELASAAFLHPTVGPRTPLRAARRTLDEIFSIPNDLQQLKPGDRRRSLLMMKDATDMGVSPVLTDFLGRASTVGEEVPTVAVRGKGPVSKALTWLNKPEVQAHLTMFNRWQEYWMRGTIYDGSIRAGLRYHGLNPDAVLSVDHPFQEAMRRLVEQGRPVEDAEAAVISLVEQAASRSLDWTFASHPLDGSVPAEILKFLSRGIAQMGTAIAYPFPRFNLVSAPRMVYDHSPVAVLDNLVRGVPKLLGAPFPERFQTRATWGMVLKDIETKHLPELGGKLAVAKARVSETRALWATANKRAGTLRKLTARAKERGTLDVTDLPGQLARAEEEAAFHRSALVEWRENRAILESQVRHLRTRARQLQRAQVPTIHEAIARQLTGVAVPLALAWYLRRSSMGEGTEWYELRLPFDLPLEKEKEGETRLDLRAFAPFVQYLFVADVLNDVLEHTDWDGFRAELGEEFSPWTIAPPVALKQLGAAVANNYEGKYTKGKLGREFVNAFLSMSRAAGGTLTITDLLTRREFSMDNVVDAIMGTFGYVAGRYTVPFRPLGDIAGSVSEEERIARIPQAPTREDPFSPLWQPAVANIPYARRAIPETISQTTGKPVATDRPLLRQATGAIVRDRDPILAEFLRVGVGSAGYLKETGDKDFDNRAAKVYADNLIKYLPSVLSQEWYQTLRSPYLQADVLTRYVLPNIRAVTYATLMSELGVETVRELRMSDAERKRTQRYRRHLRTLIEEDAPVQGTLREEAETPPEGPPE